MKDGMLTEARALLVYYTDSPRIECTGGTTRHCLKAHLPPDIANHGLYWQTEFRERLGQGNRRRKLEEGGGGGLKEQTRYRIWHNDCQD